MTDENRFDAQSRRKFLKTTGAVGAAATTGVAAFGGQAAGQSSAVNAQQILSSGLIVVSGVNVQAPINVEDVTVTILEDVDVTVTDVNVLNDSTIKILTDVVDIENSLNQLTVQVSLLGDIVGTDVVNVQ